MLVKKTANTDNEGISEITGFVREQLTKFGINDKDMRRACLAAEELSECLAAHSSDGTVDVLISGFGGYVSVRLSAKGEKFILAEDMDRDRLMDPDADVGPAAQSIIRSILISSMADRIKYRHILGTNRIDFVVRKSKRAFLYQTLGAMALAVITGLILSHLGFTKFNSDFDTYCLVPVKTMYMNALKMIVAPVVFFSIVSCIVKFTDISELGRVGGRIMSLYLFTTFIATGTGIGLFYLFRPGRAVTTEVSSDAVDKITSQTIHVSIKDIIVNIVPSDFIAPFVESDMLQLIFLAILCGIAAGAIGRYSVILKDNIEALNELFLKIMSMIIHFMPLAVFCSVCSMILDTGTKTIISLCGIFATFLLGLVCMMAVYCIIILVTAKLSPLPFLKKYPQTMLQVFSMASSNASIPLNIEACKKLGIAKKIYSLSIPLGATVNMDGGCVYMGVFALSLAKIYGVSVPPSSLAAMAVSIIVMSIGAPGIPGSGLICLSVLLTQIGVPTEAIGLIMGIDSLVGMFRCMSNCTGDVAVSIAIAKRENMLDTDVYRS